MTVRNNKYVITDTSRLVATDNHKQAQKEMFKIHLGVVSIFVWCSSCSSHFIYFDEYFLGCPYQYQYQNNCRGSRIWLYLTNLPITDDQQIMMRCQPIIIFSLSDSPRVNDTEKTLRFAVVVGLFMNSWEENSHAKIFRRKLNAWTPSRVTNYKDPEMRNSITLYIS